VSRPSAEQARRTVLDACAEPLRAAGIDPGAVGDDFDLRASGVIDSLGFLELVVELEHVLGVELDLDAADPARMTVIGELVALASAPPAAGDLRAVS
jgi:acyl carrier protein